LIKEQDLARSEIPALAPSQVQEQPGDAYILDIRLEGLYKQGHVKGSHNLPIHQVSRRYQEIPTDKRIIVIDVLGNPKWMPIGWFLKSKGYKDVMMMKGGMTAWQKEGFPLEK